MLRDWTQFNYGKKGDQNPAPSATTYQSHQAPVIETGKARQAKFIYQCGPATNVCLQRPVAGGDLPPVEGDIPEAPIVRIVDSRRRASLGEYTELVGTCF